MAQKVVMATCADVKLGSKNIMDAKILMSREHYAPAIELPTIYTVHTRKEAAVYSQSKRFPFTERIHTFVAHDCYNEKGKPVAAGNAIITLRAFPFSVTGNKFIGVGCDTFAVIQGKNGKSYSTGCLSLCNSIDSVTNGTCSCIGCCQTSIPKNLLVYDAYVRSFQNHTGIWRSNPCSYSFLVEEQYFNFCTADLIDLQARSVVPFPSVLDWDSGNQTCEEGRKNLTSYACQQIACVMTQIMVQGTVANALKVIKEIHISLMVAMLHLLCCVHVFFQDIDECSHPILNDCSRICKNTMGSYMCSCPKGQHGDGRKGGNGCASDQLLVIKISVGVGIGIMVVGSGWLYCGDKKRKLMRLKERYFEQNGGLMLQRQLSKREGSTTETAKIFTAQELKTGILPNDPVVAIKKSKFVDCSQIELFINEVVVLSQMNHRNVVKLLGCCLETEVPLLVYEFVSNGSLFNHIDNANEASASVLPWEIRLRIATETAGVLSYLHSAASMPIIHRDIKSSNILLDDKYTAKVSDFGASRLVPQNESLLYTLVQGTLGYLDPEYLQTSQLTEKSDVYSFGVLLLELLTGKGHFRLMDLRK
ncbi:Wall-associated receptor kinase [Quillaja saponaria]|uniref:Wall-associated receptor kinase n=1 Tax=Quillaja saponaria TaxID=32244 RepID=A0AAD7LKZ0_QUISA|nr:Wall-associated receptor kinase [Quillaja saponaria]